MPQGWPSSFHEALSASVRACTRKASHLGCIYTQTATLHISLLLVLLFTVYHVV